MQLMDYVYQPEVAQLITEWVLYMSPVPEVQKLDRAAREGSSGPDGRDRAAR